MKILLTGKDGQVGFALHKKLVSVGEVIATNRNELDLENPDAIRAFIEKIKPDIIINAAAYTEVDKAETDIELAHKVNTEAPRVLAEKASQLDIPIIHFSTDYVFDGLKNEPYVEADQTNPQSVYGQTKWKGEEAVRNHKKHIILRTSWVFSSHGQNFLKTILKLIQEKTSLNIVSDQRGTPTSSAILADATYSIVKTILNKTSFKDFGTYHVALEGEANWYQYACFISDEAIRLGLKTTMTSHDINKILSNAYPTLAKRPMNSRLDMTKIKTTFMLELPSWEEEVAAVIKIALNNS
ncbi:dTDP-4-dehydrorhamnose reductase subunit, NAD(P)-binding, of dTDP-L-rhamnose synthase [Candidatus Methylopumilus planktonicus]|uniref:dTDP-4-dehydrorhamnose reductase n=1 Tax=Candidatus Methylopumilus planktonicus TaxID=1581557 RepID=A0A0D6EX45_9PROT|nr:dTDP-4-dehydrorhamnose reductase [Candidatus Methylopumilus planktonicus]CEZ19818.1 dTDP-4-dehydrorhamnose reductase subunit, NAD(P)-binding, of dTDP-L-rhamnose synthase [Candidatus Methylopumilus planktonicus]